MSWRCDYCGKGRLKGHRVSHAKNRTIRHFKANLHRRRVIEQGKEVVRLLCTRCLKKAKRPEQKSSTKNKKDKQAS